MATNILNLASVPEFEPDSDPTALASRWERWLDRFENYLVAIQLKDADRRKAMLLHCAGERVYDIFRGLPDPAIPAEGERAPDVYVKATTQLNTYFSPKKNTEYERYVFRQARQETSETVDQFNNRLRRLAVHCEFADQNQEIKSQIIMNGSSARLCRRALRDPTLDLEGLLTLGRTMEVADSQAAGTEQKSTQQAEVNKLRQGNFQRTRKKYHNQVMQCLPQTKSLCPSMSLHKQRTRRKATRQTLAETQSNR